ncbi:MAG: type II secretory ATPase GspE/PulE/Tfp pilus assembly ATPase PilB-like protein [Enterobacterales bacterium]|jgi:type II secretory ATPase GspE/PulE/Tfp pilus assembly ATPase PilB-like protein/FixJ family two-component response regulator
MSEYSALFTGKTEDLGEKPAKAPVRYKILFVDDEVNILNALVRIFRQENYQISTATNGKEALDILAKDDFQLMISDFKMPVMNGGELMKKAKALYPEMIRIMLTGHADTDAIIAAIKDGAVYKFILKPWNDDDLRITIGLALEQYDLIQRNKALQEQNIKKSKEISVLSKLTVSNRSQLAIILHKRNLLNDNQIQEIYKIQQSKKIPTIKILLDKDWVDENKIREILKEDLMIDEVSLAEFQIDPAIAALLPRSFCERQLVLPLKQDNKRLMLVMADPMDLGLIDDLQFTTGLQINAVMANASEIIDKTVQIFGESELDFEDLNSLYSSSDPHEGIEIVIDEEDDLSMAELLRSSDEPPAIRLINVIIMEAIRHRASDIHIQPRTKSVVVRYRIDGILVDKIHIPHSLHLSLISRIKVMSELDITERRMPQDGRITVKSPMRIIDLRISTLPTISGEKVVMRILDRNASVQSIEQLGLEKSELKKISRVIKIPQGIILATGPTGSGKTTTLYSLLNHEATSEKNYTTIEDPVEYYLDTAGQVMIKDRIGLDFATVLRALLRQDPDVILLGEIRDKETAEIAFHAALTGHLVFSTLHTNSAAGTVARLFDLGLKPYVIASALEAIISQRLVRTICTECKEEIEVDDELIHELGPLFETNRPATFKGRGCTKCNLTGYKGRIGIYEILIPSMDLKDMIANGATVRELTEMSQKLGMKSLIEDSYIKVDKGLTTVDEILRVLGPQVIS